MSKQKQIEALEEERRLLYAELRTVQENRDKLNAQVEALTASLGTPDEITAEPAGDYEALRKQFMSLLMLANSKCRQARYWHGLWNKLSDQAMVNDAEAERDTNAMLTDALVKAEAECDQLRAQAEALHQVGHALGLPAGSDLTQEVLPAVEALRKDAERYRWLRDKTSMPGVVSSNSQVEKYFNEYMLCGEPMDKAIDAAMAAKEGV